MKKISLTQRHKDQKSSVWKLSLFFFVPKGQHILARGERSDTPGMMPPPIPVLKGQQNMCRFGMILNNLAPLQGANNVRWLPGVSLRSPLANIFSPFGAWYKITFLLYVFILLSLNGCTTRDYTVEANDANKKKIAIVYDIGGKDDRSFNSAAYMGMKRAKNELPVVMRDVEPGDPNSIEPALRAFSQFGYNLITGVGFAQGPIIKQVAADYPQLHYVLIDSAVDLPNVASLLFKEHEGSFLVGMIAAYTSKTGEIGFVGGMDIPLIHKFATGYEEGAKYVNPNIRVIVNYVGITDAAWNNPSKGRELANSQYEQGVDIIFQAAGNSGLGVFDAAEAYKKFAIGVDSNQNWIKPGFVLTSMTKNIDNALFSIVKEEVEGKFKGGIHIYGLDNGGVGYAIDEHNKHLIPASVIEKVEQAKRDIIAGKIKVTDAMNQ